ncbi:MarR family winged helix-turn-helix transcriptional regulator [Desulfolucanica intricata]|uniref:MarR family winged helix-turn-helix transcriptional regulator n=1 Tax=Desulfolucanica intricata TaxID=1285191 RepID=UPI00082D6D81|nr:MarR family transcriptional regulator [Desulfolucanica intricata]
MKQDKIDLYIRRLDHVFQNLMRKMSSELAHHMVEGVTESQFFVMRKINERGCSKVSDLAEDLCVSLSAITSLVDKLCKAGLVERGRDENDRRLVLLSLTPRGKELLDSCLAVRYRISKKYLGQLPEEDIEQLVHIYEKLYENLCESEKEKK